MAIRGVETVVNPLQKSALNKKALCDYVINVASGCLHGCTFCYVPSTPAIRTRQDKLQEKGVEDPQMDWGSYLFVRKDIPQQLEQILSRKRTWEETESGRGVVLLCSGTDPYQNNQTASVTREVVKILLKHNKRVRILTRGLLWLNDLDLLTHPNVIVGMSIPSLDDELSRRVEPNAPPPSKRYECLVKGHKQGCRLYVAMAPTVPSTNEKRFKETLKRLIEVDPETIFWEPINARGTNGRRMVAAGLDFAESVMGRDTWAQNFVQQWQDVEAAAKKAGCLDLLHIWVDQELIHYVEKEVLEYWWHRPTTEKWDNAEKLYSYESRPLVTTTLSRG